MDHNPGSISEAHAEAASVHPRTDSGKFKRRIAAWIAFLLGVLFMMPLGTFSSVQSLGSGFNLLDGSWQLEIPGRLQWGQIIGRDFIFTYGPLYQFTHALGLVIPPGDLGTLIRFHPVLEVFATAVAFWLLLAYTEAPLRSRIAIYLGWILLFQAQRFSLNGFKPFGGVWLTALAGRELLNSAPVSPGRTWARRILWAGIAPLMMLYSFDSGLYTLLAALFMGCLAFGTTLGKNGLETRALRGRTGEYLLAVVGGFAVFYLFLAVLPGWNHFLPDYWQVGNGYAATMAVTLSRIGSVLAGTTILVTSAILIVCCITLRRPLSAVDARRWGAMLGAASFALFCVRGALTRSDQPHVILGAMPCFFLVYCCGIALALAYHWKYSRWLPLLVLPLFVPYRLGWFTGNMAFALDHVRAVLPPDFRMTKLEISHEGLLEGMRLANLSKSDSLFVWPLETTVNLAAHKLSPDYTTQNYSAHTEYLENKTVALLKQRPDTTVVVYNETPGLDGVPFLTRNPVIFRYLLDNYELHTMPSAMRALLTRRPPSRQRQWKEVPFPVPAESWKPATSAVLVLRGAAGKPLCDENGLLVVRLTSAKTSMLPLGKPGQFIVTFRLASGQEKTFNFLLPPDGRPHDVLLSACLERDPRVLYWFGPHPLEGKSVPVSEVELRWQPFDWMSKTPAEIKMERVSGLRPQ